MSKNSVKKKQKASVDKKPISTKNSPDPKEFEKSVIKNMEDSKLRIKPWVLKLLGGIFILAGIGFIVFPLLSDRVSVNLPDIFDGDDQETAQQEDENKDNEDENNDEDDEKTDDQDSETEDEDTEGNIAGGNSSRRDNATTDAGLFKSTQIQTLINQTGRWRATNYVQGDIKPGNYEVKLGDTLWEISEALYGDGSQWTKILDKNSSSIGFLPDGSQALITTGQFLTLE